MRRGKKYNVTITNINVTNKYNVTSAYNHLMSTVNNNIVAAHTTEI